MRASELLEEMKSIIEAMENCPATKAEFTFSDVPALSLKEVQGKYNSTLNQPTENFPYYWTFIRIGKITFKINSVETMPKKSSGPGMPQASNQSLL